MIDKTDTAETAPPRRRGGWPKGKARAPIASATTVAALAKAPLRAPTAAVAPVHKMRAAPNWLDVKEGEDSVDRLHIPRDMIPDGMDMTWVTDSCYGQPTPQYRQKMERGGWTPVHGEDFNRQFDGVFLPKGHDGELNVDGLVLMARPMALTMKARARQRALANEPVQRKEQQLGRGDIPGVSLDTTHPSAVCQNTIKKTYEPGMIPDRPLVYDDKG